MREWHDLESYVSDLNSLLGLDVEVGDGLIRIGLDGARITVQEKDVGWAIAYESEDGVGIRVEGGVAEYYRGGRLCMRGLAPSACSRAAKAFALIVGLVAARSLGSEEQLFKRFFTGVEERL